MSRILLQTDRTFELVRYVATHSHLIFRSAKGNGGPDRFDLAFTAVRYMNVGTQVYSQFTIVELTEEELAGYHGSLVRPVTPGLTRYGIGGAEIEGYVVAGSYLEHRDDGESWEPSKLLPDGY